MASKTYDCNITNIHIDFAGFTIPPPPFSSIAQQKYNDRILIELALHQGK